MSSVEVLRKALDKFPNTTKVHSSVQIQKHPNIPEFKVAVVGCAFCGKKEKHDIFDERVEEWKQLGEKKALCKTCALKLGKIFVWYNDFKDLFSVFQAEYDLQVHVPRKHFDYCAYVDFEGKSGMVCGVCRFYHGLQKGCSWEEEKKELLEAGLENIPHEKETATK